MKPGAHGMPRQKQGKTPLAGWPCFWASAIDPASAWKESVCPVLVEGQSIEKFGLGRAGTNVHGNFVPDHQAAMEFLPGKLMPVARLVASV